MRATETEPRRPELIGAEEMRRILGVGRTAFYDLAGRDALPVPTFRIGKRFMFSRRQVEAMLDRQHDAPVGGDAPEPDAGEDSSA